MNRAAGVFGPVEVNARHASIGQKEYMVAVVRDVAERKKLERMVLQSEKMAAVGQLAGGVAHEINNPIGIILGFAQSVARGVKDILFPTSDGRE